MPSFGEQLKREREKRSISLDDISVSTKISTRMLRALEEDHFDQLPGGIFNKGFVRAYARCVGLDENQTIADFLIASGEEQPALAPVPEVPPRRVAKEEQVKKEEPEPEPSEKEEKEWTVPWGSLAIVLLISAVSLAVWRVRTREEGTEVATSPAPSTAVAPAQSSQPAPVQPSSGQPTPAPVSAAVQSSTPQPVTPQPVTPINILIKAREECWISATIDGKNSYEGLLLASGAKKISAQHRAVIRAGNSGAVDIFFNGSKVPTDGQNGEVKAFSFDENGLSTVTSTSSPAQNQ